MSVIVNGIDTKDISVVVQGAVDKVNTPRCLSSIRKHLPGSEIILSTWEGTDTAGLDYDILVTSEDPGIPCYNFLCGRTIPVNQNRQLLTTQKGFEKCRTKYAIKFRTDFYLSNANFLDFVDCYPERSPEYRFFNERVIICSIFARRFSDENGFPTPYHPSDIFLFGLTDDLKDFFLGTEMEVKNEQYHYKFPDRKCYFNMTARFSPEQYYCTEWAKRHCDNIDFVDYTDWSMEKLALSDKILFNNFIFLDAKQIGLHSEKHDMALYNWVNNYGIINNALFNSEYKKRYDSEFEVNSKYYTYEQWGGYRSRYRTLRLTKARAVKRNVTAS